MTTPDDSLIAKIQSTIGGGPAFEQRLQTDQRVLARVTDGIYRHPASALRELVANAYDADATRVDVVTDYPRFGTLTVTDDGDGMTPEVLANLVLHIGGSAKRTPRGAELGIANAANVQETKRGRTLIGKIGIGLFSIAQLARQFSIVTKVEGANYRLVAEVTLVRHVDAIDSAEPNPRFDAGIAKIWSEATRDKKAHGTRIELHALLPRVVHILRSADVWESIKVSKAGRAPAFHIGEVAKEDASRTVRPPLLPWSSKTKPSERFRLLVDKVGQAWTKTPQYARIEYALDNYLKLLWTLGLSLPIDYVNERPFGKRRQSRLYRLPRSNRAESPTLVTPQPNKSISEALSLPKLDDVAANFRVFVDETQLYRPIRFNEYPKTDESFQDSVMFVGDLATDLGSLPANQRGGDLAFVGYFHWVPRVVPREHNGVLIRIHGASGTLFDPTFLKYQVAERRLGQLIAEVFVLKGLEGALNIDRESFNTSHPHYQVLANWTHNALRLVRNTIKELQAEARNAKKDSVESSTAVLRELLTNAGAEPRRVRFAADKEARSKLASEGAFVFVDVESTDRATFSAVAQLLDAYSVLDHLDYDQQQELIQGVIRLAGRK